MFHDDPEVTPAHELQSDAGISVPEGVPLPPGTTEMRFSEGRYASTIHVGPYTGLPDAWARFMGGWLPGSGHRMGSGPSFEISATPRKTARPKSWRPSSICPFPYRASALQSPVAAPRSARTVCALRADLLTNRESTARRGSQRPSGSPGFCSTKKRANVNNDLASGLSRVYREEVPLETRTWCQRSLGWALVLGGAFVAFACSSGSENSEMVAGDSGSAQPSGDTGDFARDDAGDGDSGMHGAGGGGAIDDGPRDARNDLDGAAGRGVNDGAVRADAGTNGQSGDAGSHGGDAPAGDGGAADSGDSLEADGRDELAMAIDGHHRYDVRCQRVRYRWLRQRCQRGENAPRQASKGHLLPERGQLRGLAPRRQELSRRRSRERLSRLAGRTFRRHSSQGVARHHGERRSISVSRRASTESSRDNMDVYSANSGFPLTESDGIAYAIWLAGEAHARGLNIGQKNAPEIVKQIHASFDWALTEDCYDQGWCADVSAYVDDGKPVFMSEYTDTGVNFAAACTWAKPKKYSPILKGRNLDAPVQFCP